MGCLPQFVQSHEKELADQDLTITKYRDVLTELRRTINRQIDEAVEYLRTLRATAEKPKEGLSLKQYLQQIKKIHRRSQTLEFVTTTERLEEECVNTVGGIGRQISGVLLKLKDGLKGGVSGILFRALTRPKYERPFSRPTKKTRYYQKLSRPQRISNRLRSKARLSTSQVNFSGCRWIHPA